MDLHYNNIGQVFSVHFTDIILVAMWPVWLGAIWFIFLGNVSLLSSLSLRGRSALSVSLIHC